MTTFKESIENILKALGEQGSSHVIDEEARRLQIFWEWFTKEEDLPKCIADMEHVVNLTAKRFRLGNFIVDINNYRKERERLIAELAKAAARRALVTKQQLDLPAMNAYERRLVHVELASRPDVKTESAGEGRERHVVIRPLI